MDVRAILARVTIEVTSTTELEDVSVDTTIEYPENLPQNVAVAAAINGVRNALHELVKNYEEEFGPFGAPEVDTASSEE